MASAADDQLLAAALAAKALTTAQQALESARQALERGEPPPVDVQAIVAAVVGAIGGVRLPAPVVHVAAAELPQINVAAPSVTVQAAPAPEVTVRPSIVVDVPEQAAPVVHVAAPVVTVEPPAVHVAAPSVRVESVAADTPRAPWRMTVVRDPQTQLIEYADLIPMPPGDQPVIGAT